MVRAAITGHHAAGSACERSATERAIQFVSRATAEPDDEFSR